MDRKARGHTDIFTARIRRVKADAERFARATVRHEASVLAAVLIGLVTVFGVSTRGMTLSLFNVSNIFMQTVTTGIAAIGQSFVILTAGIDLSVGGIAVLCSMVGTLMMKGVGGIGLPIFVMLLVGLGVGSINGLLVSRFKIPPLIVTLAMWQITKGVALIVTGGRSVWNLPPSLAFIGQARVGIMPVAALLFIGIALGGYFVLQYTTFGRSIYALGGNPVSAWLSGINVKNVQFSVYAISGFLAAVSSVIETSRLMVGTVISSTGLELDTIAAVCIGGFSLMGGRGSIIGVVLGIFILLVISNGMNVLAINPSLQIAVRGAIILVAVEFDTMRTRRR